MEYNKTVNLPQTEFKMKANLRQLEPAIQKFWNDIKLYELMLEENKANQKFVLHDGPPYANGHIHMGHALNKILKDIVIKYKAMKGFYSPYIPGWDCHGLPIEFQLLKELGITRYEIDQIKLRKKAASFALKFVGIQKKELLALGLVGDWENPYLTLDHLYEVKILEVFKILAGKGYIYRRKKPVYWCSECETALAEAEVEYADHNSPSVYVKFKVLDSSSKLPVEASVLIWTTTPWTLPANAALAFHPDFEYAAVDTDRGILVLAEKRIGFISEKLGLKKAVILETFKGKELEGIRCANPILERNSTGVCAAYITLEEGTGVVHIAPGHGQEDYATGLKYDLPVLSPVDDKGRFTEEVPGFAGQKVFEANKLIIQSLTESGALLFTENTAHSYPHCWRCKSPVIFRATFQWFLNIEKNNLRNLLLEKITEVKWSPAAGENRIASMVQSRPDWCLSRQRNWGVPIPVFFCKNCKTPLMTDESISAFQKLVITEGTDSWFIRTPLEILGNNIKCEKCGGNDFEKEKDILDVWFDSGSSYECVLKQREMLSFPADLYLEGSDQHRGWFQASLINAVAAEGISPFKEVLTHGFVVDANGKKMSKSVGNVIMPEDIMKNYGADILRLWVASVDYSEDIRVSEEIISHIVDSYRRIRNTFKYMLGNLDGFYVSKKVAYEEMPEIDRYIMHELSKTITLAVTHYDNYEFHRVYRILHDFCAVQLSSFYFDCVKDRLYTFQSDSLLRRSAQTVLYELTANLVKLMSPIISHTAEEAWGHFGCKNSSAQSVFLAPMPEANTKQLNNELAVKWEKVLAVRAKVTKALELAREKGLIGNSLQAQVLLFIKAKAMEPFFRDNNINWNEVFIVSAVKICDDYEEIKRSAVNSHSEELSIGINKAPGKKCIRCWNYSLSTGNDAQHPEICARCLEVIKALPMPAENS